MKGHMDCDATPDAQKVLDWYRETAKTFRKEHGLTDTQDRLWELKHSVASVLMDRTSALYGTCMVGEAEDWVESTAYPACSASTTQEEADRKCRSLGYMIRMLRDALKNAEDNKTELLERAGWTEEQFEEYVNNLVDNSAQ